MTAFDEAELRHWLVDYSVIGCSPNDDDFEVSLKDFSIGSPEVADALSGTRRLGSFLGRRRCLRREILRDLADYGNLE
jgi:hypothetical protein